MKVRGDFVTNSSSVSYILTVKESIIDKQISNQEAWNSGVSDYLRFIKDKMKNEGKKTILDGEEVYCLTLTFDNGNAIPLEGFNDEESLSVKAYMDLDINNLTDEDLNEFLYWTILNPQYLIDFGVGLTKIYSSTGL